MSNPKIVIMTKLQLNLDQLTLGSFTNFELFLINFNVPFINRGPNSQERSGVFRKTVAVFFVEDTLES